MRKFVLMLLVVAGLLGGAIPPAHAQTGATPYLFTVEVESAWVRALPTQDADFVASVFEDDRLEVVGRNVDGTWFMVRRPGRFTSLGWLSNEMGDWDFHPEDLPLLDYTTGIEGPSPLVQPPAYSIHVIEGVVLRTAPFFQGERVTAIPAGSTVPVLARSPGEDWLYVNYRGYTGWIISFVTREIPNLYRVPVAPGLPPVEPFDGVIIPPEVQLAQVNRMRDFVAVALRTATDLDNFWWLVNEGEVVPCEPPGFLTEYLISSFDVRELPELNRYVPRFNEGIDLLNASVTPIHTCGVVDIRVARGARADAINARIIFEDTLDRLSYLEDNVIR